MVGAYLHRSNSIVKPKWVLDGVNIGIPELMRDKWKEENKYGKGKGAQPLN